MSFLSKRLQIALPIGIVLLLLGGLFFFSLSHKTQAPSMRVAKPLPIFESADLYTDEKRSSESIRGSFYLLNFWGSWCPTCYAEHPYLMELKQQGVPIIGVNYKDSKKDAFKFLDAKGNPYIYSFFDPKGYIAIEMGITAAPETFVISPDGQVVYHRIGEFTKAIFEQDVKPLIEGGINND